MRQQQIPVSSPLVLSIIFTLWLMMATAVVWLLSYDTLVQLALNTSGKHHLEQALRENYFTPDKFRWLQYLLPLATLLSAAGLSLFWKRLSAMHVFRFFLADIRRVWQAGKPSGKWEIVAFSGIFVFICIKALYYIIVSDINYDEAWSYNYYTANPWYLTPFIYSNYPLHELLTHLTKWLPFPMYINLRLPVLATGMIWLLICYLCTARLLSRRAGLFAMAFMGTLPPASLYMLQSKGFLMVAIFALLQLSLLYLAHRDGWTASKKRWYILAVFMGFWSSAVFILPFTVNVLSAILLNSNATEKGSFSKLLQYTTIGIAAGLLVYVPVMAGTGMGPLLNAAALKGDPAPHHTMWWHIKFISLWITGWSFGWMLMAATLAILLGQLAGKFRLIALSGILSILSIVLVPVIAGSYAFPRIWIFLLVPLGWAVISVIIPMLRNTRTTLVFVVLLLLANTCAYAVYVERTWSNAWNQSARQASKVLLENKAATYYTDFDYFVPIVEFHYRSSGQLIQARISNSSSLRYADTTSLAEVDAIVTREKSHLSIPDTFALIYRDSIASVYLKP